MKQKIIYLQKTLHIFQVVSDSQKNLGVILSILASVLLWDFLFYQAFDFGINLAIMTAFLIPTIFMTANPSINKPLLWTSMAILIIATLNFVMNRTLYTGFMYFVSMASYVGIVHAQTINNLLIAPFQTMINFFTVPFNFTKFITDKKNWNPEHSFHLVKFLKIAAIPFIISIGFLFIYGEASTKFYSLINDSILSVFSNMDNPFDSGRFWFWIISGICFTIIILPLQWPDLKLNRSDQVQFLNRDKKQAIKPAYPINAISLTKELNSATITLVSLNVILLIMNLIDVKFVWLDFSQKTPAQLSEFVHQGTWNLILAIVLGVGLILIYFRKNLNFHPQNSTLKYLAYVWLAQNAFLALSTLWRNAHYIYNYGLTHKRIGVLVFTIIVGIGIYYVYLKIANKLTLTYIFNRYILMSVVALTILGAVNQQKAIIMTSVYIQPKEVDVNYLYSNAGDSRYLLYKYEDILNAKAKHGTSLNLEDRYDYSQNYYEEQGWRAWNFGSWYNAKMMRKYRK